MKNVGKRFGLAMAVWLTGQLAPMAEAEPQPEPLLRLPRYVQKAYRSHCRALDGKPGTAYWQNRASYKMSLTVAPPNRQVSGTEEITYYNDSPDALPVIVFRLYMDAHRPEAIREELKSAQFLTSGVSIDAFEMEGVPALWDDPKDLMAKSNKPGATYHVMSLAKPMPPHSSRKFFLRWHYDIAEAAGWKEGMVDDSTYFLAYFFPRVSVYSDTTGWDTLAFSLGREFSNDFSDFQFEVRTPKNFVVWATGDLANPEEVLQPTVAEKLKRTFVSDEIVNLAQADDIKAGRVTTQADFLTWKWKADNVPDIAIAISNSYIWDAGSIVVDSATGRRTSVQSAYSRKALDFKQMVHFGKLALAFGSTKYPGVPYPYSKTTLVEGGADEEYPMMVNDESIVGKDGEKVLPNYGFAGFVAAHELLHSWFPFYMGINEKRYPCLDEGWTTAFEFLFASETYGVEAARAVFKSMRTDPWELPFPGSETPVITPHDILLAGTVGQATNGYGKAGLAYLALRDLMGEAAFKKSLHDFMATWHGKHPLPWDMFSSFRASSGVNYDWFFYNWFYQHNYPDVGVKSVQPVPGGYQIEVSNLGGMAIPFDLQMVYQDGTKTTEHHTPAVWQNNPAQLRLSLSTPKKLKSVLLDSGVWVDFAPEDNRWESAGKTPRK